MDDHLSHDNRAFMLDGNREVLVNRLDFGDNFLTKLVRSQVMSDRQRAIIDVKPTDYEKAEKLLDFLRRLDRSKYEVFLDVLNTHQADLANILRGFSIE